MKKKYGWLVMTLLLPVACFAAKKVVVSDGPDSALTGKSAQDSDTSMASPRAQGNVFYVYLDKGAKDNHYIPSGWMGDYGDLRLDDGSSDHPHSGRTCIKISYSAQARQGANWAGIYWQHPANNWGEKPGGFDLTGKTKLTFWARGAKGGEKSEFKMGGISGDKGDSDGATSGPVTLTQGWKQYTIDLSGKNISHIIGGFCWVANRDDNPNGAMIYLDDIRYE